MVSQFEFLLSYSSIYEEVASNAVTSTGATLSAPSDNCSAACVDYNFVCALSRQQIPLCYAIAL